jgi:hypothetical protein
VTELEILREIMYSRTPLIQTLVIRIGLAPRVNLSRILQNYLALNLPVTGSSTVECYGFQNSKSDVMERFRLRYILYIVTTELQTAIVAYFSNKNPIIRIF